MADFSVSDVASKIKAPEGISLSDMMSMSLNAQKFKQAQQVNPLLLRQQEALTTEAEETLEPKITKAKAESETSVYGANTAKLKNIIDASTNGVQQIQQLHSDPNLSYDKVVKMVSDTINNSSHYLKPEDKQSAITQAMIGLNPNATKTEIKSFLAQKQASALSAQAQAEKLYPTAYMQDTGKTITPIAGGNPLLTGLNPTQAVGTPIAKTITPSEVNTVIGTDQAGNPIFAQKTSQGNISGVAVPTPTTPVNAPQNAVKPIIIPPGETKDTLANVTKYRNDLNASAAQVPNQQFNANQIIKLADETNTGTQASMLVGMSGGYAYIPWTANSADNYNRLGHYVALQAASLAESAGLNATDTSRELSKTIAGDRTFTKESLKSVSRVNRALASGTDLLNRGVEAAIQKTGSPFAAREFRNQWSKVVDVNALRLYDALKNNDQTALKESVKDLGGIDSNQYKSTLKRVDAMKSLIQGNQ